MRRGHNNNSEEKILFISTILVVVAFGSGVIASDTIYSHYYDFTEDKPEGTQVDMDFYQGETNYIQRNSHPISFDFDWNESTVTINDIDTWSQSYGKSMQPTMWSGHTLLMREFNLEEDTLQEGMVLRYEKEDGGGVVHRLQGNYHRTSERLLLRGDNNRGPESIDSEQVTHQVVGVLYSED